MSNPDRSVYDPVVEDDLYFDSATEEQPAQGRWTMIVLAVVVVLAFGLTVWVAYWQGAGHAARGEAPLLAQPGPTRVPPPAGQVAAAPDNNPIFKEMTPNGAAAPATPEALGPAPEEPAELPPSTAAAPPPAASGDPVPDMTTADIGISVPPNPPGGEAPAAGAPAGAVDPLAPGASLPPPAAYDPPPAPVEEIVPPPISAPPPPAIDTAKIEAQRIAAAKAAAAKKKEAERLAALEQQRLAAIKPPEPAAPPIVETPPSAPASTDDAFTPPPLSSTGVLNAPPAAAARTDASRGPTLLTPPSMDLAPPGAAPAPPSREAAAAPETPAAAPPARPDAIADTAEPPPARAAGGQFVVQIGAFVSAEDAASSWKRIEKTYSAALAGASPEIRQTTVNGAVRYRLRAAGYGDRTAAQNACNRLKAAGQSCFVAAR